jgi:UDP-N-acetylglucosamine 2-epimerase (non-hydrolysing)
MKLKVITVVGTRPEIIRLSRVINKLEINFNHILVHTGQNYDFYLNNIFFKQLNIKKPTYNLNCSSKSAIEFIGKALIKFDKVLDAEKPDAVFVLGDTNSALVTLCAKKRKIPLFHMEAGNRCFDDSVPEEINRRIIDHIADINLTYSSFASTNLQLEGIHKDRIIKVGSPLFEVYNFYNLQIKNSKIINKLNLKSHEYILVSIHREENVDVKSNLKIILKAILLLQKKFGIKVIFSCHPRTRKKIKEFKLNFENKINFHNPFGFFDYVQLMKNSKLVLSDSGSITEETSILSIPSLNIRSSNERQEGMEYGTTIMTNINVDNIINSADITLKKIKQYQILGFKNNLYPDYANENVSDKIVSIIQSYTHYINKKVWFKF